MPCNHWDCGSLPRSYGAPCGDGEYRVPWRNCVLPQRFRLLFHHQYAILSLSINIKATSAPAGSRCCNSYWLSGYKKDIKIMKKNPVKCKRAWSFEKNKLDSFNHKFQLRLMLIYNFPSPISIDET